MHFPEARPICSEVTARQLAGFGIAGDIVIRKPGEKLDPGDFEFEFIGYPYTTRVSLQRATVPALK